MKKFFKFFGAAVLLLVLVLAVFVAWVAVRGIPTYAVPPRAYTAPAVAPTVSQTVAQVALGGKIVRANCAGCHANPNTGRLSGARLLDLFPGLGKIYSPNITQDSGHGIATWTDNDLAAVLRTGIGRDGRHRVIMPHFVHLSETDMQATIAFLRSASPAVQADATPTPPQQPSLLLKFLTHTVMRTSPLLPGPRPTPPPTPALAYGRYLAIGRYQCFQCHSQSHETNNALHPEESAGYLGGGTEFHDRQGQLVRAPNLTPDPATGLGNWTPAQLTAALRYGQTPHGPIRHPMPVFSTITDEEVRGLYAYLQAVPHLQTGSK